MRILGPKCTIMRYMTLRDVGRESGLMAPKLRSLEAQASRVLGVRILGFGFRV